MINTPKMASFLFRSPVLVTSVLLALFISGCGSTLDKIGGLGQINHSVSKFDGSKEIELSKSHNFSGNKWQFPSTKFGALWSSNTPDSIYLRLIYLSDSSSSDSYTSFSKIKVNLNGEISEFLVSGDNHHSSSNYNNVTNVIYTESRASVILDKSYLEKMIEADECKIRVSSNDGYEDIIFDIEEVNGQQMSKSKLRLFLLEVNKTKND